MSRVRFLLVALIRKETMKKILIVLLSLAISIFGISGISPASATTCPFGGSPNWKGECDTTTENGEEYFGPPMTEEEAKSHTSNHSSLDTSDTSKENVSDTSTQNVSDTSTQNVSDTTVQNVSDTTVQNVSDQPTTNNSLYVGPTNNFDLSNYLQEKVPEIVKSNPDVPHGYAAVDVDGNILNIMSCTYNICGKNNDWVNSSIFGGQFPKGTRIILQTLSDEKTGNVAGYMDAKYDNITKSFSITDRKGVVFQIPITYPGSQELVCIKNCDLPATQEITQEGLENINIVQENSTEKNLTPMIFSTKLKPNTFATIVAKNKNKTKIWKTKVNKNGIAKIKVNKKYKKWNFKVKVGS
jgi:hypothetical protein